MTGLPPDGEATPVVDGAAQAVPVPDPRSAASTSGAADPPPPAAPAPPTARDGPGGDRARAGLLVAALVTGLVVAVRGPADEPGEGRPIGAAAGGTSPLPVEVDVTAPEPPPQPPEARPERAVPPPPRGRGQGTRAVVRDATPAAAVEGRRRRPRPASRVVTDARPAQGVERTASPGPSPGSLPSDPVPEALARYLAGDLPGARALLEVRRTTDTHAAALAARLEAIERLLGRARVWPPHGGAAALERLIELEAGLDLPRPSALALRAAAVLADRQAEKGARLADEGRWEEARAAFEAALDRRTDHAGARDGLERVEQAAHALYLEGYALEEDDAAAARRRYLRAGRLSRPGSVLAERIAARLAALHEPGR